MCRYGREEFTLILLEASLEAAQQRSIDLGQVAKKMLVHHKGQMLQPISISVGLAVLGEQQVRYRVIVANKKRSTQESEPSFMAPKRVT